MLKISEPTSKDRNVVTMAKRLYAIVIGTGKKVGPEAFAVKIVPRSNSRQLSQRYSYSGTWKPCIVPDIKTPGQFTVK
jgi:hypothetical protein